MLNKKPGPPDRGGRHAEAIVLGHVGLYVRDLARMRDFYTRVLGLEVTDESAERRMVFLSSRPAEEHHEVLLIERRDDVGGAPRPSLLQQVAFNVDSLAELRRFKQTFEDEASRSPRRSPTGTRRASISRTPRATSSRRTTPSRRRGRSLSPLPSTSTGTTRRSSAKSRGQAGGITAVLTIPTLSSGSGAEGANGSTDALYLF